jgi:FkbM family methyltransferase
VNLTLEVERENRPSVKIHMDVEPNTCPADKTFVSCLHHYNGFYEPSTARFFVKAIREGDYIVDIGANIGYFSLLAAVLTGPTGHVLACEPLPANIEKLQANILCNSIFNIKLVTAPIWSREEEVTLYAHEDGRLASLGKLDSPSGELKLRATTLRKLWQAPPRILKIDAEGAELDILEGGDWLINPFHTPYVICEINEETAARTEMGDCIQVPT